MRLRAPIALLSVTTVLLTGCTANDPQLEVEVANEAAVAPASIIVDNSEQALRRWRKTRTLLESGRTDPGSTHHYQAIGQCQRPGLTYPECELKPCSVDEKGHWYSIQESRITADPAEWTHVTNACLEDPDELLTLQSAPGSAAPNPTR